MEKIQRLLTSLPNRVYLLIGLFLRLLIAPFVSHPFDMRIFMAVGAAVAKGLSPYGQYVLQDLFLNTPHPHLHGIFPGIGYPPPWGLLTGLTYLYSSAISPNNLYVYVLALKIPIILGELAVAVLVYKILDKQIGPSIAKKGFLFFLFCPFIISVGTVWGMFDILALLFALIAAISLNRSWMLSSLLLSISSVLKIYPIILAPVYSLILYKSTRSTKVAIQFILLFVGLMACFTLVPMLLFAWPLSNLYNALTYHLVASNAGYYGGLTQYPYGAASPFNAFTFLDNITGGSLQLPSFFNYLWIPAYATAFAVLWRKNPHKFDFSLTVQWSLFILLVFFTSRAWVSEQNLIFLLTFFALSIFLFRQDFVNVTMLWILLFSFVMVHVPAIAFFWLPYPSTLVTATTLSDGPFGWIRLLCMTLLTLSGLILSWSYVLRNLRGSKS